MDLTRILDAIQARPNEPGRWLTLANWLSDNGRYDEAAAVRVFYPVLQDSLARGATLDQTLDILGRNAARLGRQARLLESEWACRRTDTGPQIG